MLVTTLCLLSSCSNDVARGEVHSIAYLKGLCRGTSCNIVEDVTIRGIVVANDWMGECYKSIIVADDSGGMEVAIDSYAIYELIPVYSEVEIFCNGLALSRVGGKLRLGLPSSEERYVENIPAAMVGRYIRIVGERLRDYTPRRIDELCANDICTPVLIEQLRMAEGGGVLPWCDRDETGEFVTTTRTAIDASGQTIEVRTPAGAIYAGEKTPEGTFSLGGVPDYTGEKIFMRITNHCIIE